MSNTFKTCLFGGFDKEDVISYIEKTARENRERTQELTDANEALQRENDAMRQELESLRLTAANAQETAEKYEALRQRVDELVLRAETLEKENGELRVQADEYRSMKDHIAEIEISAHRRTQEFRAAAIAKLHDTVAQQRTWFSQRRAQVADLYEGVLSRLREAQESLGQLNTDGFDAMAQDLDELDRKLDEE